MLYAPTPGFVDVPVYLQNRLWFETQNLDDLRARLQETLRLEHVQPVSKELSTVAAKFDTPLLSRYDIVCPFGECEFLSEGNRLLLNDRTHWASAGYEHFGRRACRDDRLKKFIRVSN